jgi:hypothetical protein
MEYVNALSPVKAIAYLPVIRSAILAYFVLDGIPVTISSCGNL